MASTSWSPAAITAPTAPTSANPSIWATNKVWTKHRALIEELYNSQKLAEVMEFMEIRHNFKATVKMYKKRFTEWGLGKNNRDSEMRAIVRKNKQRRDRGKQSIIHIRGKAIDDGEVTRYWKRKGISIDDVITHRTASATPEAVQLFTRYLPDSRRRSLLRSRSVYSSRFGIISKPLSNLGTGFMAIRRFNVTRERIKDIKKLI